VEGVTAPAVVTGPLAEALRARRETFNARIDAMRKNVPGFEPERFAHHFAETAGPVVDRTAALAPASVALVVDALFEVAAALAARGSLGPAAGPLVDAAWKEVLPAAASLMARTPARITSALTDAVCNLALTSGTRPHEWIARMSAAGPSCATSDEWLTCGFVAAWTSGMAHFRTKALSALPRLSPAAVRAVLGLPENGASFSVSSIAARLHADPWLRPEDALSPERTRELEIVATAGGFRGLGGPFIIPPDVALSDGRFVVFDGRGTWLLSADACGATFVRIELPVLDSVAKPGIAGEFEVGRGGRVTFGDERKTFPILAEVASMAANATTLVVALPRSHYLQIVALQAARV
jgi:hypothetical protein